MKQTFKFDLYLLFIFTLTFVSYVYELNLLALAVFLIVALITIYKTDNILYLISLFLFIQMSTTVIRDDTQITTIVGLSILPVIILDFIKYRKIKSIGALGLPLIIFIDASLVSLFNAESLFVGFVGVILMASIFVLYVYFINTLPAKEETFSMIAKIFLALSSLVTLQMVYIAINLDLPLIEIISRRMIDLGWENINIVVYPNLFAIPMVSYLLLKARFKLPYLMILTWIIIGISLTLSRSSLLSVAVYITLLVPYVMYQSQKRILFLFEIMIFTVISSLAVQYIETNYQLFSDYYAAINDREWLRFTDRLELAKIGFEVFKDFPIIGTGGLFSSRFVLEDYGFNAINYHNTFVQTLTLGTLGVIAFIYLQVKKLILVIKIDPVKRYIILVLLFVTIVVNGMFQPMYYYATYMFYLFLVLASVEKEVNYTKHPN